MEPDKEQEQVTHPQQPETPEAPDNQQDTTEPSLAVNNGTPSNIGGSRPVTMDVVPPQPSSPPANDNSISDEGLAQSPDETGLSDTDASTASTEEAPLGQGEKSAKPKKSKTKLQQTANTQKKPILFIVLTIIIALVVTGLLVMSYVEQSQAPADDDGAEAGSQIAPEVIDDEESGSGNELLFDSETIDEPPLDDESEDDQQSGDGNDDESVDPDTPVSNNQQR